MGISARMQNVNYRLLTYLLPIPTLIFYTLSLTGCVSNSPGVPNIFLVKLESGDKSTSAISEIRVGYFGICTLVSSKLNCQSSSGKTTNTVLQSLSAISSTNSTDSYRLASTISFALTLQSKILPSLLAGAGVLFALSLFFIVLLKKKFKVATKDNTSASRRRHFLRLASFTTMWLSVAFSLASATSINQTTNAIAYVTQEEGSNVRITAGKALNVLQWLAFASSALFAAGVASIFTKEGGMIQSASSMELQIPGNPYNTGTVPPPPPPPPTFAQQPLY